MKKLFIVFAVLCLAAPAMAADWNFYGSARFKTFYEDFDPDEPGQDNEKNLTWNQQGNSRIGANVKVNDEISGRFEYGAGPNLRLLYGTYNFGGGQFQIGQDYTPSSSYFYSNSVFGDDGDLLGVGAFYLGRVPMVQVKLGGLKLAAIRQATPDGVGYAASETLLPKLEVSYGYKADQFFVDVFGGYQTYEVTTTAGNDEDIASYVLGIGGGVNFGPVYFKAGLNMGENYGNYGAYNPGGLRNKAEIDAGGNLRDTDNFGWLAVLGFKASDMLTLEAGYGVQEAELDGATNSDEIEQMYLNAVVNITKGFFVVPEVGLIKDSPAGGNSSEAFYIGAKWQINF